jgi:general secretion pathway protein B
VSFILDALRKSEHDRQRTAAPSLSQVPLAAARQELPAWALALIAFLAIAVLGLGGAWWRGLGPSQTSLANRVPAPRTETPLQLPAVTSSAPTAAQRSLPAPPSRPLAAAAEGQSRSVDDARAATARPAPDPVSDVVTVSSASALAAEGIAVPPLHLQLHAYSQRPADRFVFINGTRYVEGDRLAEGPQLVTIEPNGAVLSQQGRRFLLAPD